MKNLQAARLTRAVLIALVVIALASVALLPLAAHAAGMPALVPQPAELKLEGAALRIEPGAIIATPPGDAAAFRAARALAERVRRERGLRLVVREDADDPRTIRFERRAIAASESYELHVDARGVRLVAGDDAGFQHGSTTLWQLLTPDAARGAVELPGLRIADAPRFRWRGLMLDVARHFMPLAEVKAVIDQMALHKLNVLHLHLTDDQGWRVEIKRWPKLTNVGAWRTPPGGKPARYGGYYTQDQLRELVAYAAERFITIVPEIDMPGHAQAAVAAYPEFGVDIEPNGPNSRPQVSVDWGVNPYLFNPDEATLRFLREVIDEVIAIFPGTYVHIGGDEAIKDQWKASPAVQRRMRELGLANEEKLQSWFIGQIGAHLASKGRRLVGWDEILEGGLPASATVMSWRGVDGAIAAAKLGHDVVLAPAGWMYFDHLQSRRGDEPQGRIGPLPIERVHGFEPLWAGATEAEAKHVLGVEAALWSEYITSRRHVEHALFPRLAALAEVAWSPPAARDIHAFTPRLARQMQRYERQGLRAADSAFAVDARIEGGPAAALAAGHARVSLSNPLGWGEIRYTLDGSVPTPRSPRYAGDAVDVARPARLRALAFDADGRALAAPRTVKLDRASLLRYDSSRLTACPKRELGLRVPLRPEASDWSPVFDIDLFDACWIVPQARLDGVRAIRVDAARLARNYGLAHDQHKVVEHPRSTPHGELDVRLGRCDGEQLASVPLPAGSELRRLALAAPLPAGTGVHDLCLRFTAPIAGPYHAIEAVRLQTTR